MLPRINLDFSGLMKYGGEARRLTLSQNVQRSYSTCTVFRAIAAFARIKSVRDSAKLLGVNIEKENSVNSRYLNLKSDGSQ